MMIKKAALCLILIAIIAFLATGTYCLYSSSFRSAEIRITSLTDSEVFSMRSLCASAVYREGKPGLAVKLEVTNHLDRDIGLTFISQHSRVDPVADGIYFYYWLSGDFSSFFKTESITIASTALNGYARQSIQVENPYFMRKGLHYKDAVEILTKYCHSASVPFDDKDKQYKEILKMIKSYDWVGFPKVDSEDETDSKATTDATAETNEAAEVDAKTATDAGIESDAAIAADTGTESNSNIKTDVTTETNPTLESDLSTEIVPVE